MALLRRCATLRWIRTRFTKLNENSLVLLHRVGNADDRFYRLQLSTPLSTNSLPESHAIGSNACNTYNDPQTKHVPEPESSNFINVRGLCYADVKKILEKWTKNQPTEEESYLGLLTAFLDMWPDSNLTVRRRLIHRAWDLIKNRKGPALTVEYYNLLLRIYGQNSQYLNADEFLDAMNVTPDKDTFKLLLAAVAEIGDYSQTASVLAKMKEMGYPANEVTFNSLILAHSVNADIEGAKEVLVSMQAVEIKPDAATYCALARGFAAKGELESLMSSLDTGNLNIRQLMSVIKSLSLAGHGQYIPQVMTHLSADTDAKRNDVVCTIVDLTYLGRAKDACRIIDCLLTPEMGSELSLCLTDFFLHELVKSETRIDEILEICENLRASKKHAAPLLKVTEAALRLQNENVALAAFAALRPLGIEIRPHFYWPLIVKAASSMSESDVIRLIKHMIDNKVSVDDNTLQDYVIPFLYPLEPLLIVRKLQDCGMKISAFLSPLLATLLSNGNLKRAVALTDKIKGKITHDLVLTELVHAFKLTRNANATAKFLSNIKSGSEQNGKFLQDLLKNDRVILTNEELGAIISALQKWNLKISAVAAEALRPRITLLKKPAFDWSAMLDGLIDTESNIISTSSIPHPEFMTAEELQYHLRTLMANGMNTRGVLRRLLQVHCRQNNLKEAEEFAKMFTDKGFQWTGGMVSSMFILYAAHGRFEKAEVLYDELKTKYKDFKIDEYKIIDYATALVKSNKWERALEVLAEQEMVRSSPETSKNCWRLLSAVAASGNPQKTTRTLHLLINKGYCKMNIHLLGPVVKTHLTNGDLTAAVDFFTECVRSYRKSPLQQELVRALVRNSTDEPENNELLAEVLSAIKSIHGSAAANSHLLMALAAVNKQKQLHTFIQLPSVNQTTLRVSAEKLAAETDLHALQAILKACRGVKKLDITIIYDLILDLCCRAGDYDTALEMWDKLQLTDEKPRPQFVEKLKTLLISQRVSLPPEMYLAAKARRKD